MGNTRANTDLHQAAGTYWFYVYDRLSETSTNHLNSNELKSVRITCKSWKSAADQTLITRIRNRVKNILKTSIIVYGGCIGDSNKKYCNWIRECEIIGPAKDSKLPLLPKEAVCKQMYPTLICNNQDELMFSNSSQNTTVLPTLSRI